MHNYEAENFAADIGSECVPGSRKSCACPAGPREGQCLYWHRGTGLSRPGCRRTCTRGGHPTAGRGVSRARRRGNGVLRVLWVPSWVLAAWVPSRVLAASFSPSLAPWAPPVMMRRTAAHGYPERTCQGVRLNDVPLHTVTPHRSHLFS
jgi:hypothetical protein